MPNKTHPWRNECHSKAYSWAKEQSKVGAYQTHKLQGGRPAWNKREDE